MADRFKQRFSLVEKRVVKYDWLSTFIIEGIFFKMADRFEQRFSLVQKRVVKHDWLSTLKT